MLMSIMACVSGRFVKRAQWEGRRPLPQQESGAITPENFFEIVCNILPAI